MGVAHESMGPGRRIPPRVGGGVRGPGRHRHRSPVVCPADARDGPHAVATVVGAAPVRRREVTWKDGVRDGRSRAWDRDGTLVLYSEAV